MAIEIDVKKIILNMNISEKDGLFIVKPKLKTDRIMFLKAKIALQSIGGVWTEKGIYGFVFKKDPRFAINNLK